MTPSLPSQFPPPFDPESFVAAPTDAADDRIEVGVLVVGAGPAGLACAIRFGQLLEEHPDVAERLGEVPLAVVEKGKQPGVAPAVGRGGEPALARASCSATQASTTCRSYGTVPGESVYVLTRDRRAADPAAAHRCATTAT